jgi:hypothetical protein
MSLGRRTENLAEDPTPISQQATAALKIDPGTDFAANPRS